MRWLEKFSHAIEQVAAALMALVTLLVFVSALGRYLFSWPVPDAFDIGRYLLGATIMWGFASVGFRGSHIKVDLVAEVLPASVRRWVDAFAWAVLLVCTVVLAWKMLGRVEAATGSGETTSDLRLPIWPFLALIWAGVAVSVVTILARLVAVATGQGSLDHFEDLEAKE